MSLVQTVITHHEIGVLHNNQRYFSPPPPPTAPVACHSATIFWLLAKILNAAPTLTDITNRVGISWQPLMGRMVKERGVRINKPAKGVLWLTPGSVIVFCEDDDAKHSCIAINQAQVGGYNQVDWFNNGKHHSYSIGAITDLKFGNVLRKNKVKRFLGGTEYNLFSVSENDAIGFINGVRV